MEPEGPLQHSQAPSTCPYPKPVQFIFSTIYASVFQVVSLHQVSRPNPIFTSPIPHTSHMPRPSFILIW